VNRQDSPSLGVTRARPVARTPILGSARRAPAPSVVGCLGLLMLPALCSACDPARIRRWPRLEVPVAGTKLDPPPPASVVWLRIASAHVPAARPNGNPWDEDGSAPDPYVVLSVEGEKLLQSTPVGDDVTPTWKRGPHGNYQIADGAKVRLEVIDDDGLGGDTIAAADVSPPRADEAKGGIESFDLGGGVTVALGVEPAHALYGLGFDYKFVLQSCHLTKVFAQGPAGRAGMRVGDELIEVGGAKVSELSADNLRAMFGPVPKQGLMLQVLHEGATTQAVHIAEGPVYPLTSEYGPID
jgi:hypothetical protein